MRSNLFRTFIFFAILVGATGFQRVWSGTLSDTTLLLSYPYPQFSNNAPVAGERIRVRWVLGIHPDGCIPEFETGVTKTVNDSSVNYIFKYKMLSETNEDIACTGAPIPYGPTFYVGPFEAGYKYRIFVDTLLIREFSLSEQRLPYAVISPSSPRIGDAVSVQWVLGEDSVNCVPQYSSSIVSTKVYELLPPLHVFDVTFEEKEVDYVACIPRHTPYGPIFELGVVGAGEYVIYYDNNKVANFSVTPEDTSLREVRIRPERPDEGDTVQVQLILGYGSSSCAPRYTTSHNVTASFYQLSYETTENTDTVCTADYAAFGPKWTFPAIGAGDHVFHFPDGQYYKLSVTKKRVLPDFPYVTIRGSVYEPSNEPIVDTMGSTPPPVATVPQCTVTVVFNNTTIHPYDTMVQTASSTNRLRFIAVTDENGNYAIDSIPVAILIDRMYLAAVKGDKAGYRKLPIELTEEMKIDIPLAEVDQFIDSIAVMIPESSDIISLLRQLGLDKEEAAVTTTARASLLKPSIVPAPGGFRIINPSAQRISIAAYTMNGRSIWKTDAGYLPQGGHLFTMPPNIAQGVVLIHIQGEHFRLSKLLSFRQR
jgi:hypothetical protein